MGVSTKNSRQAKKARTRPPIFLYRPDGSKHHIRSEAESDSPRATLSIEQVDFAELEDGRLVETIKDPQDSSSTLLAVCNGDQISYAKELEYKGRLLVPVPGENIILRHVRLAEGATPYESPESLFDKVLGAIREFVDIPDDHLFVLGGFVLTTWLVDRFPVAPYVSVFGPPQSGKTTLLRVLNLLCRRPILVGDISSAALYDVCDKMKPTLIIDECTSQVGQTRQALRHLLRVGNTREIVARKSHVYSVYGAKVIASLEPPDDAALISRCILVPMTRTSKADLVDPGEPSVERWAKEAQKLLLRFRFDHYKSIKPARVPGSENLPPRDRDLLNCLAAILPDNKNWPPVLMDIFRRESAWRQEQPSPPQSAVLSALFSYIHFDGSDDRQKVGTVLVGGLTDTARRHLHLLGESRELTARKVGDVLRSLGLGSERTNQGWRVWLDFPARQRIHRLAKIYRIVPPDDPLLPMSTRNCRLCRGTESLDQAEKKEEGVSQATSEGRARS